MSRLTLDEGGPIPKATQWVSGWPFFTIKHCYSIFKRWVLTALCLLVFVDKRRGNVFPEMKSSCLLLPLSACSLLPVALDAGICNFPVAGSGTREADLLIYSTQVPPAHKESRQGWRKLFPSSSVWRPSAKDPLKATGATPASCPWHPHSAMKMSALTSLGPPLPHSSLGAGTFSSLRCSLFSLFGQRLFFLKNSLWIPFPLRSLCQLLSSGINAPFLNFSGLLCHHPHPLAHCWHVLWYYSVACLSP